MHCPQVFLCVNTRCSSVSSSETPTSPLRSCGLLGVLCAHSYALSWRISWESFGRSLPCICRCLNAFTTKPQQLQPSRKSASVKQSSSVGPPSGWATWVAQCLSLCSTCQQAPLSVHQSQPRPLQVRNMAEPVYLPYDHMCASACMQVQGTIAFPATGCRHSKEGVGRWYLPGVQDQSSNEAVAAVVVWTATRIAATAVPHSWPHVPVQVHIR